jgi:hypothetical protein
MKGKVFLMGAEGCGTGDRDIGYSITMQFLEALAQREDKPAAIIMWNTAVSLLTADSPALSRLKKLEQRGVKILAGRLCTTELCIADKIVVGQIVDMQEILDLLMNNEVISL